MENMKKDIKNYWKSNSAGIHHSDHPKGSKKFFDQIEIWRYTVEDFIPSIVNFSRWENKDVLEVGCGLMTDGINFLRHGCKSYTGLEPAEDGYKLSQKRVEMEQFDNYQLLNHDVEEVNLDKKFDLVYSWGVLHHTDEIAKNIDRCYDLMKDGGTGIFMMYHKNSIRVLDIVLKHLSEVFKNGVQKTFEKYTEYKGNCPRAQLFNHRSFKSLFGDFKYVELDNRYIHRFKEKPYREKKIINNFWGVIEMIFPSIYRLIEKNFGFYTIIKVRK